jgi:mRNA interferase YafQ
MKSLETSNAFRKDFRRILKRGCNGDMLFSVVALLLAGEDLPQNCHPHKLSGTYEGFWDCHIKSDWILIYDADDHNNKLVLVRTGTHSDLFK